jgi:hypothetical protein
MRIVNNLDPLLLLSNVKGELRCTKGGEKVGRLYSDD